MRPEQKENRRARETVLATLRKIESLAYAAGDYKTVKACQARANKLAYKSTHRNKSILKPATRPNTQTE